jgi:hypothetical protein
MFANFRDLPNAVLAQDALTVRTVTTTTTGTGTALDFLRGDGRCVLQLNLNATSLTAVTVRVQQSTLTNSGFTDITGASCSLTTSGITGVSFDRDARYLQAVAVLSGTTAVLSAVIMETLKTF